MIPVMAKPANNADLAATVTQACAILRRGGVVALPTETVYGLAADATNAAAVEKIFRIKGRPATNPLIVHVADIATARRYATVWPEDAQKLAATLWPGPLTLVLPKHPSIVAQVTAGKATVGLRCPAHPLALAVLREFDGPLAAPSANRSNRVSPTTAEHVQHAFGKAVDLILDGGPCTVGIESTVLDLSHGPPTILRPGGITRQQIEAIIGKTEIRTGHIASTIAADSPGQQTVHYSPHAPAYRFSHQQWDAVLSLHPSKRCPVLAIHLPEDLPAWLEVIKMPDSPQSYAQRLYDELHRADAGNPPCILIELPPSEWLAITDRIMRATRPVESMT